MPVSEVIVSLPSPSHDHPSPELASAMSVPLSVAADTLTGAALNAVPAANTAASSAANILFRKLPFLFFILFQPSFLFCEILSSYPIPRAAGNVCPDQLPAFRLLLDSTTLLMLIPTTLPTHLSPVTFASVVQSFMFPLLTLSFHPFQSSFVTTVFASRYSSRDFPEKELNSIPVYAKGIPPRHNISVIWVHGTEPAVPLQCFLPLQKTLLPCL